MNRRRYKKRFKNNFFIIFLIIVFCITVGYALLNTELSFFGAIDIKGNTWNVYYDNINIKTGSVTATTPPTTGDTSSNINFVCSLLYPGDFYEFTIDVVNDGTVDAIVDSIALTPVLDDTQKEYINYTVEYQNGEQITKNQLVSKDSFIRLKVRIEHRTDYTGSQTYFDNISASIKINYVPNKGQGVSVRDNGVEKVIPTANGSLDDIGTAVTIGTEQFYTIGTAGENVKLLSMMNITLDETPIQSSSAGTTMFSNSTQHGTNYSDYTGSIVEGYVNNYKTKLEEKYEIDVKEARLILKDELEDLGCDEEQSWCEYAPKWVYSISYWTSTADDSSYIWFVHNHGNLFWYDIYNTEDIYGVRPVIVLKKSDIVVEKKLIEFTIEGTTYYAEEGMTWEEWVNSEYNTSEFYISDITVNLKQDHHVYSIGYKENVAFRAYDLIYKSYDYILEYGGFEVW